MPKKSILEVIFILFGIISIFTFYSFQNEPFKIGSSEIKQNPISKSISNNNSYFKPSFFTSQKLLRDSLFKEMQDPCGKLDTSSQRILLTGDSMIEGLMWAFKDYADHNGHQLFPAIYYSSSTKVWGEGTKMKKAIEKYKPTLIIMCLGANELFIRNIVEDRDKYVKEIMNQVGDTKFLWIGPPNWKEDTGINELIKNNVGDDRFFLSKHMKLARARDGAHPTKMASYIWADSICNWITQKSCFPIKLDKYPKITNKNPHCVFLND